jgi:hypothetical protein
LADAQAVITGQWRAYDLADERPIFVDGPYGSASAAAAAAHQLSGVETATNGGVYRVTAPMTGHLGAQVTAVASCLDATANHSGQTF